MTETKIEVESQLNAALRGVSANKISEMQTLSGVKDGLAQHWINELLNRAKEIRTGNPGVSEIDIYPMLKTWLDENCPGEPYNPLLSIEGESATYQFLQQNEKELMFGVLRTRPSQRHARRDTTHNPSRDCKICLVHVTLIVV